MQTIAVLLCLGFAQPARASSIDATVGERRTRVESIGEGSVSGAGRLIFAQLDHRELARTPANGRIVLEAFPIPDDKPAELNLQRFHIAGPSTRFVLGRKGEEDVPLPFDPSTVILLRGEAAGRPGSHVFLSAGDFGFAGTIDLGPGGGRFEISSVHPDGASLAAGTLAVFRRVSNGLPAVPLCGIARLEQPASVAAQPLVAGAGETNFSPQAIRQIELAVDTDYEYFQLFDDPVAATAYLVQVYGAVSDIFLRDLGVYVTLSFTRVWESSNDLYNSADPLHDLRVHWANNMGAVQRDVTQLLSGRRDYAYGGIAYLSVLCNPFFGYSAVGYASGSFPDPTQPSIYNYDVHVATHELGHQAGTGHTHDYGLDTCHDPATTPRRGSLMSYCSQTWSGGNANTDNNFHTFTRQQMLDHINSVGCLAVDCNLNGIADVTDIANLTSDDVNANDVPDECEDCNNNLILDPTDIAGASNDVNTNGVPDECESDCDNDGEPDEWDILMGQLADVYGDGLPDVCETDCDANKASDYSQIQTSMPMDIDRDARLDACQNCDGDGQPDLVELAGAHGLWVASGKSNERLRRFFATTGVRDRQSPSTGAAIVNEGQDVLVVPDGRVLVSSAADDRVMSFDNNGSFLGNLVAGGVGGLDFPTGLALAPSGALLVASRNTDSVLSYNATTGASLGAFVAPASGGLESPHGLTISPQGHLLVTSSRNEVLEYDGLTGAFRRAFVSVLDPGGLDEPRGLTFKSDGNLLVASFGNNLVLEYDGASGLPLYRWAKVGTVEILNLISPWAVRVGPNGNVYVSRTSEEFGNPPPGWDDHDHDLEDIEFLHLTQARVYEFDVRSGNFIRTHVAGNDHGLDFASGMSFVPGWQTDCNWNQLQDSCDIASGSSLDTNANSIPDECEVDCNGNDTYDRLDLIPYGASLDCDFNFVPDECDIAADPGRDENANGRLDECERLRYDPSATQRNRYIAFETPHAAASGVGALRVTFTELLRPSPAGPPGTPDFSASEGRIRWIGPPAECNDAGELFQCATVQCQPHYRDWSDVGLLFVTGQAVIPSSAYTIETIPVSCQGNEAGCGLAFDPIVVRTGRWGDVAAPFQDPTAATSTQPNAIDIGKVVDKVKAVPMAPPRVQVQLQPGPVNPANGINAIDVGAAVDAVKGFPYPFGPPPGCP